MSTNPLYQIALSLLPDIGPRSARKLVAHVGSVEGVFLEKKAHLLKIPGISSARIKKLDFKTALNRAERETDYLQKHNIHYTFYLDKDYPNRLKECEDGPVVLYYKGNIDFNANKIISVVGTRKSTSYGEGLCREMIADLARDFPDLVIVSGFAYGIDICAHKAALKEDLSTIAVFGMGIEKIYPAVHAKYINQIMDRGGMISEFPSDQKTDPGNFISRNRIIAGLADATVVVESGAKGGALITADMALSYNRDVFSYPGRVGDPYSTGCNKLIQNNVAALIESGKDLEFAMKWDSNSKKQAKQTTLFVELSAEEEAVVKIIKENGAVSIDSISRTMAKPVSLISTLLLNLEFNGIVQALPGKNYKLN